MKLVSFIHNGTPGYGIVKGEAVIDLTHRLPAIPSLKALLEQDALGEAARFAEEDPNVLLQDVKLAPPIVDPAHVWCLAINYQDHIEEVKSIGIHRDRPEKPALFMRYADTLMGAGEPILKPSVSDALDYEGELAVIIGRGGHNIAAEDAWQHVAGYTCFNDVSVRDFQFHTRQIAPGKNFLASGALGPWLVTADEIIDPHALSVRTAVNGEFLQDGNTRDMIFSIPEFIAYVSSILPLKAGDILATGTPAGVGFSRKPPIYLKAGDSCDVVVEGVGTLTNPVVAA